MKFFVLKYWLKWREIKHACNLTYPHQCKCPESINHLTSILNRQDALTPNWYQIDAPKSEYRFYGRLYAMQDGEFMLSLISLYILCTHFPLNFHSSSLMLLKRFDFQFVYSVQVFRCHTNLFYWQFARFLSFLHESKLAL